MKQPVFNLGIKSWCMAGVLLIGGAFTAVTLAAEVVGTPDKAPLSAQVSAQTPDKIITSVATQVLVDLDKNREQYRKDPAQLRQMIDKYLLANFDTEYAARAVLGKNWRTATQQQRTQFIDAFYQSLLQSYGNSLLDFTADRLKILPYQGKPDDIAATVRSEIRRDNGSKVPVNYTLRKTPTGWKAWDLTIEGVSYVKSFRTDFGTEIEQKGLDAVIKRLQIQQAQPAGTARKSS
jgi:phospholipid transport system substrate-binding protein